MNKTMLALVIMLFTLTSLMSPASYAGGRGDDRGHGARWDERRGGPDWHAGRGEMHRRGYHGNGRGDFRERDYPGWRGGDRNRFAWRGDEFRRGYPAPQRYRGDYYRVDDWRHRGLQPPPRGHYWSYIDGRYVLIAAATGVITAILMGNLLDGR